MSDNDPQTSTTYCASCGGDYSRKDKPGDCGRCFILNQLETKHGVESEEYKSASMRSQCLGCGACVRHLKDNLCGKCRGGSLVLPEDQPRREQFSHQMAQGRAKRRLDHIIPPVGGNQAAMLLGGQPGPNGIYGPAASILHPQGSYNNLIPPVPPAVQSSSQPLPPPPTMPLTTQALSARRQTLDGSGIQYQITVVPMYKSGGGKGAAERNFGRISLPVLPLSLVQDFLATHVLTKLNEASKNYVAHKFVIADVTLRWHDNLTLKENTEYGSWLNLYNAHIVGSDAHLYFPSQKGHRKINGVSMEFELYIDIQAYERRTKTKIPKALGGSLKDGMPNQSQQASAVTARTVATISKVQRPNSAMISRRYLQPPTVSDTEVTLDFLRLENDVSGEAGELVITSSHTGRLADTFKAKGRVKSVFSFTASSGQSYVAKRLLHLDLDNIDNNYEELLEELITQNMGNQLLEEFYTAVGEKSDILDDRPFSWTDINLAAEYISDDGAPSPASGITTEQYNKLLQDDPGFKIYWLVEPLRTMTIQKYTGTLDFYVPGSGRLEIIMNTFTHFTYENSGQKFVISDLQASPSLQEDGSVTHVLFDANMHNAGAGGRGSDFGDQGIEHLIDQHRCNHLCVLLDYLPFHKDTDDDLLENSHNHRAPKHAKRTRSSGAPAKSRKRTKTSHTLDEEESLDDGTEVKDMDVSEDDEETSAKQSTKD